MLVWHASDEATRRLADRAPRDRRRAAEIIRQDSYRGWREGEHGHCRSRAGEPDGHSVILPRTNLDHDVSSLTTAVEVAGRSRAEHARWNLSLTVMLPPQHGQGCESGFGSLASAPQVTAASGCAAGTSSRRRAWAMFSARVPLASTLVGWAWAPGFGRFPAPGTQKQAGALVEAWVNTGAACPAR